MRRSSPTLPRVCTCPRTSRHTLAETSSHDGTSAPGRIQESRQSLSPHVHRDRLWSLSPLSQPQWSWGWPNARCTRERQAFVACLGSCAGPRDFCVRTWSPLPSPLRESKSAFTKVPDRNVGRKKKTPHTQSPWVPQHSDETTRRTSTPPATPTARPTIAKTIQETT